MWRMVARWLEHRTDEREVLGSGPGRAASELWLFSLPYFSGVFRRRHQKPLVWSLLSGVYARGSKRSHAGRNR